MRLQLTPVLRDVVQAYAEWMNRKKQEIKDYYLHADTPKHYKDAVAAMFKELDKDDSGIVQLDELLAWAAEKNPRQGSKVPDEFIISQFTRVDLDGSNGLDFDECLLLQYLGCLNMLWCGCCGAFIDTDKEDGFTCTSCYGKFGRRDKPGERQLDLCIKCHESGKGDEHRACAGDHHSFVHMSEIKTPETITCICCGAEHGMVLGYMQGDEGDRHVRPVPGNPDQWLCELCALTACKCGDRLAWNTAEPRVGALFSGLGVLHEGGCPAGKPSLKQRWIASNAKRHAPHCKGCKEALLEGTMPFPPEPLLPPPPASETTPPGGGHPMVMAVATTMQGDRDGDLAEEGVEGVTARVAAMAVAGGATAAATAATAATAKPVMVSVATAAQTSTVFAQQAVCICCQDVHDLTSALDGKVVKGYMFANGFPDHMKHLGDGTYLCEWCAKYTCEKCGTPHADTRKPSLAKWSKLRACPPSEFCEATKWGGMASVRAGMRKKADDMGRGHCRTCRHKIVTETLMDLSVVPRQDRDSDASSTTSTAVSAPVQQQTVVCFCCQEVHDVTSALNGSRVPAYVPKDDFNEHTKELADGRFLCEWCSKWKCHRCGMLKWTDRPQLGLWSVSTYYCKNGCEVRQGGPHVIEKTMLRAASYDLGRAHCRTCREKILTNKLTEIAPPAPQLPVSGGGAAPPVKQTNVGKVVLDKDSSSCSIQ